MENRAEVAQPGRALDPAAVRSLGRS